MLEREQRPRQVGISGTHRQEWAQYSLYLSLTVLGILLGSVLLAVGQLAMGGALTGLPLITATLLGAGGLSWIAARRLPHHWVRFVFSILLPLGLASGWLAVLAATRFDLSWDGQWYHQEGILQIKEGWNFLYHWKKPWLEESFYPVLHYPKAAWVNAALLYQLTHHLEASKVFNFLVLGTSFFAALGALLIGTNLRTSQAVGIAALLALNPVGLSQLLTFEVDGQVAACLLMLGAFGWLLMVRPGWGSWWGMVMAMAYLIGIKFSGLLYAGCYAVGMVVAVWVCRYGSRVSLRKLVMGLTLGMVLGVGFVGFNPYVTNWLEYGNIGYPVQEDWFRQTMRSHRPRHPGDENPVGRLFYSVFSQMGQRYAPEQAILKWPGTVYTEELLALGTNDWRQAGLGPLFSAMISLAAVLLLAAFVQRRGGATWAGTASLFLLFTALVHPEGWWARYAPQLWFIPLILAAWGLSQPDRAWCHWLGKLIVILALANVILVGSAYGYMHNTQNQYVRQSLERLKSLNRPIEVYWSVHWPARVRFAEAGIAYRPVLISQCRYPVTMRNSYAFLCNLPQELRQCPPFATILIPQDSYKQKFAHCTAWGKQQTMKQRAAKAP